MVHRRQVLLGAPMMVTASLVAGYETVSAAALPGLSQEEIDGLAYMREEEKLAHDVYVLLYGQWNVAVFDNISGSESVHMASVKNLLDRYGLDDPAAGNAAGVFQNQTLQALYWSLVEQGQASLSGALWAGTAIEEIDILDLEERMAQADESPILQVYGNLLEGSKNHLRAFVRTLYQLTGEAFEPQYLDQAAADAILSEATGQRRRRGR